MSSKNVVLDVYGMAEQRRFARMPTMSSKSPVVNLRKMSTKKAILTKP